MRTAGDVNLEKMKQYPTWSEDWQILSVLSVFNGLLLFYLSGRKVPALPGEVRPEASESLKFGCPEKLCAEVDPLPCQPGPTGFRRSQRYLRVQLRAQLPAGGCGYGTSVCSPAEAAFPPNFSSSPAAAPRP